MGIRGMYAWLMGADSPPPGKAAAARPARRAGRRRRAVATRRRRGTGVRGVAAAGGGSTAYVPVPLQWRGTTRQVCGLFPWGTPGKLPLVGVPIGRHQKSGGVVCFDHVNWFLAKLIANPSVTIIARPGLGKSTLAARIMLGLSAMGYGLLIPGDTKPDYVRLTEKLGGDVRPVRRAGGTALNPCDPGGMKAAAGRMLAAAAATPDPAAAARLTAAARTLAAEAVGRAAVCICSLIELSRRRAVEDYEESAISAALRLLYERDPAEPLLAGVDTLLGTRPAQIREVLLAAGDADYDRLVTPLRRSIRALLSGQYGDVFSRRVTRTGKRPPAVNIDTSAIKGGDPRFLAAVMIAAWSDMYGMVEADQALADEGLALRRQYCLTLDELWRVLDLGGSLPQRVNEVTRLNRTQGVGQIMISHSIREINETGSATTDGMAERSGALIIGGVPKKEILALDQVVTLTGAERTALRTWWSQSQAALDRNETPPGAGKFLIKPSAEDPGIPVGVTLTSAELAWGGQNTNERWDPQPPLSVDGAA